MEYQPPLLEGHLLRRYKRFFADIRLANQHIITAHCPNTGSLRTCCEEGARVWVSKANNPKRKLAYTWEAVLSQGCMTGVHPRLANPLVEEALAAQKIHSLRPWPRWRREVAYPDGGRADFLLEGADGKPPCYVEVKSVSMRLDGIATFPDSVSARGTRHMEQLASLSKAGLKAVVFFVIQRTDCVTFRPADEIDPHYGKSLRNAIDSGVQVMAWCVQISTQALVLKRPCRVIL